MHDAMLRLGLFSQFDDNLAHEFLNGRS